MLSCDCVAIGVLGGRQSVISGRSGLCSFVSSVGGKERMLVMWVISVMSCAVSFWVCVGVGGRLL